VRNVFRAKFAHNAASFSLCPTPTAHPKDNRDTCTLHLVDFAMCPRTNIQPRLRLRTRPSVKLSSTPRNMQPPLRLRTRPSVKLARPPVPGLIPRSNLAHARVDVKGGRPVSCKQNYTHFSKQICFGIHQPHAVSYEEEDTCVSVHICTRQRQNACTRNVNRLCCEACVCACLSLGQVPGLT
jgi:hypothetical protein